MNPTEIESRLRSAPRPAAPEGLREQLVGQIQTCQGRHGPERLSSTVSAWRRWWPALAPAAVSAACAVMLTLQQLELRDLRDSLRALSPQTEATSVAIGPTREAGANARKTRPELTPEEEIARLKDTIGKLSGEIAQLEQMQIENSALRTQLATLGSGGFTPEEQEFMAKARERAQSIQCVNNLKQIGLAARVYGQDNGDVYSSDFLSMSNELSTPKVLVCPGDTNRPVAADWTSFTSANCSYEYLAPNGSPAEPQRVLARCPIHGNIGLCDGSVMMGVAKAHPEALLQRESKLYYQPSGATK